MAAFAFIYHYATVSGLDCCPGLSLHFFIMAQQDSSRLHTKLISSVAVYMYDSRRPQMDQVFRLNWIAFVLSDLQGGLQMHRIPNNHGIGQQIQVGRLVRLASLKFLGDNTLLGKEEKFWQIRHFLAFVKLGLDEPAQGMILEVAGDEQPLDQPSVCLQGHDRLPLTRSWCGS